jgi:hypothetical protein
MAATAFAEEGEFETARQIMNEDWPRKTDRPSKYDHQTGCQKRTARGLNKSTEYKVGVQSTSTEFKVQSIEYKASQSTKFKRIQEGSWKRQTQEDDEGDRRCACCCLLLQKRESEAQSIAESRRVLLGLKAGQTTARPQVRLEHCQEGRCRALDPLHVSARDGKLRPLLLQFEAELKAEGLPYRIVHRTGCLKQQIIDYTNSEKEILFAVIESPATLDAGCNSKDKALSELWRKLKCPLVVVMDGARA